MVASQFIRGNACLIRKNGSFQKLNYFHTLREIMITRKH